MPREPLDLSFNRNGRPLSVWLRDLVDDDAATRLAAGKALQAMQLGMPIVETDLTDIDRESARELEGRGGRFAEAVRAAAKSRELRKSEFVRRLIARRIVQAEDWRRRVEEALPREVRPSAVMMRLIERLKSAVDETERREATRRWKRWVCANMSRNASRARAAYAGAEAMTAAGFMVMNVFDALDLALLEDREGLWRMLHHKSLFRDAALALARIGPQAVDFAKFFLDLLDAGGNRFYPIGQAALGSIGRSNPVVIDALLLRVRTGSDRVRIGAIRALGHAGPPLAGRLEAAVDILLGATYKPELASAATWSLASVGRDHESARRRVLELASPRPPRWRSDDLHPEGRWDDTMIERGSAISALCHFRQHSAEIVPILEDALDTFEEFDPDQDEHGEHGRICRALGAFGAEAALAVPRLARYLDELASRPDADHRAPNEVCRLLASLGESASACLPALERLRAARARADGTPVDSLDPDDPLDRAILAIRGEL